MVSLIDHSSSPALQNAESAAAAALAGASPLEAIERVAARLGNTPTICWKCYIHPEVLNGYIDGDVLRHLQEEVEQELREDLPQLRPEEVAVLSFLRSRIARELKTH